MDLGTEGSDPHSSSVQHPMDQPPCQPSSFTESGSEVEEKPLEVEEETSSPLRDSRTQRRGSDSKTDEEDSKETERKRDSCISGSESEGCSSWKRSRKRKTPSSGSSSPPAGAAQADERGVTPRRKTRRTADSGRGGESGEAGDAQPGRCGARGARRGRRSRGRSPGDRPPPLRKRLVTAVRALSEAIYEDVAGVWERQGRSPLTCEQRWGLGQLWEPLCAALQTVYSMANQAAYVFPAESWLVPAPPPGPQAPAGDGGEARGSPTEGHGASVPGVRS